MSRCVGGAQGIAHQSVTVAMVIRAVVGVIVVVIVVVGGNDGGLIVVVIVAFS